MAPTFPVIATTSEPVLHVDDFWLTEAPVYDAETGLTWFTDIPRGVVYSFDHTVGQSSLRRIEVGEYVGCLALIEGDKEHLAVGAKKGFGKLNIETGKLEYYNILYPDDQAKQDLMRINDGTADVKGRFWAAAMRSFGNGVPQNEGAVFCSDPSRTLRTVKQPVAGPNGFAFSPDNTVMYFVETRLGTIFSYDYDAETGAATNETEFIKFDAEVHGPGAPDGIAISTDGDLWVAVFNGNKVIRFDPATKAVKGIIEVPTSKQVACPAFVGEGLIITTGKLVHLDPEVGKGHSPHAGDVFYVPLPGVRGAEVYKVRFD